MVAYSDVLRLEEGDQLEAVTTVYPGYIRTKIHERSVAAGRAAGGLRPRRAGLRRRPHARPRRPRRAQRDLATTRQGTIAYALVRLAPRGLVDQLTRRRLRALARKGHFGGIASEFAARLNRG